MSENISDAIDEDQPHSTLHHITIRGFNFVIEDAKGSITVPVVAKELEIESLLTDIAKESFGADIRSSERHLRMIDVGANVGMWTVFAQRLFANFGVRVDVIAIEALTETVGFLWKNVLRNCGRDFISIRRGAVIGPGFDRTRSEVVLGVHPGNPGAASMQLAGSGLPTEVVGAVRLGDVIERALCTFDDKGDIDLIKLDVEGAEFGILMDPEVPWQKVRALTVELHVLLDQPRRINAAILSEVSDRLNEIHEEHRVRIEARWPPGFVPAQEMFVPTKWRWDPVRHALLTIT